MVLEFDLPCCEILSFSAAIFQFYRLQHFKFLDCSILSLTTWNLNLLVVIFQVGWGQNFQGRKLPYKLIFLTISHGNCPEKCSKLISNPFFQNVVIVTQINLDSKAKNKILNNFIIVFILSTKTQYSNIAYFFLILVRRREWVKEASWENSFSPPLFQKKKNWMLEN